jgi:YVTN family beta-propeller protein
MRRRRPVSVLLVSGFLLAGCSHSDTSAVGTVGTANSRSVGSAVGASVPADSGASNADEAMDSSALSAMSALTSGVASFAAPTPVAPAPPTIDVLPGMPPVVDPHNIYSEAGVNMLGAVAQQSKAYAYVPNTKSGDVWVIDQRTFQVVNKFPVGQGGATRRAVARHDRAVRDR